MKKFNVTGLCVPSEDYMVDIGGKIEKIVELVNSRCYFTITRARQYGKTTTLACLEKALMDDYIVISTSFEGLEDESFASSKTFCSAFVRQIVKALRFSSASKEYAERWADCAPADFQTLSDHVTAMCEDQKVVLIIDEVDKAGNYRVFLQFLGMLREKFLSRKAGKDYTFHSVILAGIHDIKNIRLKMANDGLYTPAVSDGAIFNSPWNIAVNFAVDMSFNPAEISTMLAEYENDHHTGMDIAAIAEEIHGYTNGYPFLVTRICQCVDTEPGGKWTTAGIREAVNILVNEKNTLFDDLVKNLENHKDLYSLVYDVLIAGAPRTFTVNNPTIGMGAMYGIIHGNANGTACVANRIFEMVICDYFISKDETEKKKEVNGVLRRDVVKDGRFDMELCMRGFAEHCAELFDEKDRKFLERHGRLIFLSYLKPLINGQGFYHIESQFTDLRRMDIVVDFGRDQFIVELKIWHGDKYKQEAYGQLLGYMESKKAETGYMLTFDFRKGVSKQTMAEWVEFDGRRIFDVVV